MTHEEIVTEIADELNIVAADSLIRLGRLANQAYKRILTSVGMQPSLRVYAEEATTTIGDPIIIFESMWKVTRIYYVDDDGQRIFPIEHAWDDLRSATHDPVDSDSATKYAIETQDSDTVTVLLDVAPETEFTMYADGYEAKTDLQDDDEPAFPSGFHDIIIDDVLRREYRKREKVAESKDAREAREQRIGELRLWYFKTHKMDNRQGALSAQQRVSPWRQ